MDVRMPGMDGLEATRQLAEKLPETKVLIFTAYSERSLLGRGFESGAKGYVLKEAPHSTLVRAIEKVATGDGYVDPALMPQFLAGRDQSDMLTPREREILQLLADGLRTPTSPRSSSSPRRPSRATSATSSPSSRPTRAPRRSRSRCAKRSSTRGLGRDGERPRRSTV